MKNLVGLVVAGLLIGAQSAQAVPTLKLRMTQSSASMADCTNMVEGPLDGSSGGNWLGGGTCEWTTTAGLIQTSGTFGAFLANQELAVGAPVQAPPALWLNSTNGSVFAGSITIELIAMNYNLPIGNMVLATTASGSAAGGSSYSIGTWFDPTNSGNAGVGTSLLTDAATGFTSISATDFTGVTSTGLYTVSWILTVNRLSNGLFSQVGVNGTLDAVPAPGVLGLLGLGLLGLGAVRRRVK